jgi:predicted nucleic acid-binding Zn ribbon protein
MSIHHDPVCENCGCSLVDRFGEDETLVECPSCADDFKRLTAADKLVMDGWSIVVRKQPERKAEDSNPSV